MSAGAPAFLNQTVLISGAGRGIGKRLALAFAVAGAKVGMVARSKAELDLAQLEISHAGGTALGIICDVGDFRQVTDAVERFSGFAGAPRILVTAHGAFGDIGPVAGCRPERWLEAAVTNLGGALHLCRAVLPPMIGARSGKIVFLTGPGADGPRPNFSAYSSSQSALARLAETLAEEVRESNIQVNCMNPGPTYTSLTDDIIAAGARAGSAECESALELRASGGTGPGPQVELAQFLCSERANHISGMLISVSDKWKRLEHDHAHAGLFKLRRLVTA